MNIIDLETCELVEFDNLIIGGAETYTDANTFADKEIASSQAYAGAFGDRTNAITKTRTKTRNNGGIYYSYASASAEAIAKDDKGYSKSSYDSISIWVSN